MKNLIGSLFIGVIFLVLVYFDKWVSLFNGDLSVGIQLFYLLIIWVTGWYCGEFLMKWFKK